MSYISDIYDMSDINMLAVIEKKLLNKTRMKYMNKQMSTTNNTQSNHFWATLNFVLMVVFFSLSFKVNAQQKIPLPNNAKLKTIEFKEYNYFIKGYVANENFVEGQEIIFFRTKTDTIISGTYFIKDGISYVEGKKEEIKEYRDRNINGTKKRIVTNGLFKITNSIYKVVSDYDPLNDRLSIKNEKNVLAVSPLADDKFWKEVRKDLKKLPATFLTASYLDIKVADVYSYKGYLKEYSSLIPINVQKKGDNYYLKIDFRDRTLETIISYETLKKSNFLDFDFDSFSYLTKIIKTSENVKLTFKNGNIFIGEVYYDKYEYNPIEGLYRFSNGDEVIGKVQIVFDKQDDGGYYNLGLWKDSKTTFADGNVVYGDWAEKYKNVLSRQEWSEVLKNSKTLTEIRDKFESNENYQFSVIEQKSKKQESKIAEQQKQIEEQEYKNALIKKYGTNWGNLIFKEEFTLGMTKEMVLEFKYGKAYKISKVTRDGNYTEIWEFDPLKLEQEIIKEKGAMAFLYLAEVLQTIDTKFPNLIFTNNKLSAILQH